MTTSALPDAHAANAARIEDLFCQGLPLDRVLAAGDWTADDVKAVLADRAWDLDASGRLPRSKRITTPRGLRHLPPSSMKPPPRQPGEDDRLEELQEQLAASGAIDSLGGGARAMFMQEAAASVALDGETQVIGGAYTATEPRPADPPPPDTAVLAGAELRGHRPDPNDDDLPVASSAYIAVLQARDLGVDHDYQRPLDESRVARMVADWDPRMLGTIDVSDRGPDSTPFRYAVINGQHRAVAAARVSPAGGDVWLPCTIHEGLDVASEAALMHRLDRMTKKLSGFDQWRARRTAGDPAVLEVEAVCAIHGLQVDPNPTDGSLRSYGSAEKILKLGGRNLLDKTLAVLRSAYGTAFSAYQAPLLMGVGQLLHREPDLDATRLRNALAGTRPEALRATATALRDIEGGPLHELMSRAIAGQYKRTQVPRAGARA